MATATWSETLLHDGDANFRVWGSSLSAKFASVSAKLTKTSDTGQINWTTVTRPAVSTDAGYEVYYLNDAMHSTAPIYIKIYYGTGTNAAYPRIRIEFGTGSNGAGTLTGTGAGNVYGAHHAGGANTSTTLPNYLSVNEGFFALNWRVGASNQGFVALCRTCDADGTINGDGALYIGYGHVSATGSQRNYQILRYASPDSVIASGASVTGFVSCHRATGMTAANSVMPNGDFQSFLVWTPCPDLRPLYALCGVWTSQAGANSTFTTKTVGTATRTFMCINSTDGYQLTDQGNTLGMGILWE